MTCELVATVLGVACVVFAVKRSVWTFPLGIGSVTLVGWLVWRERLYSDALLQGFFVAANLYGWASWRWSRVQAGTVVVERLTTMARVRWAAGCVVATAVWGALMTTYTDAEHAWWDAGTAVVSVAAQWLMAQRKLENWVLWVAVDAALVPLYLAKDLPMIALLYLLYLALAIWGLIGWRRVERLAGPAVT